MAVHAILPCQTPIRCRDFRDLGSVCINRSINVNARELYFPNQVSKVKRKHAKCSLETFEEKLENTQFKHIYSKELYNKNVIKSAIIRLEGALKEKNMSYDAIYGREKSLYSIHKKMSRKKLRIDEIYDIYGLRIILETKGDCFLTLDIITHEWPRVLKIKDYISCPKPNRYQSVHVIVINEENIPIEIQIRSREMHIQAEYGIAAHWIYKQQQLGDSYQN